jgi:hypothetical protein
VEQLLRLSGGAAKNQRRELRNTRQDNGAALQCKSGNGYVNEMISQCPKSLILDSKIPNAEMERTLSGRVNLRLNEDEWALPVARRLQYGGDIYMDYQLFGFILYSLTQN